MSYQPQSKDGFAAITDNRIWSTDDYSCVYFNNFVRQNIECDIRRPIKINGQIGNSWRFKRFIYLNIHVKSENLIANR